MARVEGVKVTPHFCRIEEKPLEFFQDFHIWVLGLDSLDARRYMNQIACSFLGGALLWHSATTSPDKPGVVLWPSQLTSIAMWKNVLRTCT